MTMVEVCAPPAHPPPNPSLLQSLPGAVERLTVSVRYTHAYTPIHKQPMSMYSTRHSSFFLRWLMCCTSTVIQLSCVWRYLTDCFLYASEPTLQAPLTVVIQQCLYPLLHARYLKVRRPLLHERYFKVVPYHILRCDVSLQYTP